MCQIFGVGGPRSQIFFGGEEGGPMLSQIFKGGVPGLKFFQGGIPCLRFLGGVPGLSKGKNF